jgi:hypothetical protein
LPPSAEPPRGFDPLGRRRLGAELGRRVGAPHLVPLALALAAAAVGWWALRPGGWGSEGLRRAVTSPETQVREALARQARARLGDVYGFSSGGTLVLDPVTFGDVTVRMDGGRAQVLAIVDASGEVTWHDGHARVGYVGREGFTMKPCSAAGWCADGVQFARLRAALATLFRRLDAERAGDAAALAALVSERFEGGKPALLARLRPALAAPGARRATVKAWQVRVERDTALVGEDREVVEGDGPPRPERARYGLAWEDGRWRFVAGL